MKETLSDDEEVDDILNHDSDSSSEWKPSKIKGKTIKNSSMKLSLSTKKSKTIEVKPSKETFLIID